MNEVEKTLKEVREELVDIMSVAAEFNPAYVAAMKKAIQVVDKHMEGIEAGSAICNTVEKEVKVMTETGEKFPQSQRLKELKKKLEVNRERLSEYELNTKYRKAYEKIQTEIAELEKSIGEK